VDPAAAHRAMADDLDRISDGYAATDARRSKQSLAAVKSLMNEDRLMRAKEARRLLVARNGLDKIGDAAP